MQKISLSYVLLVSLLLASCNTVTPVPTQNKVDNQSVVIEAAAIDTQAPVSTNTLLPPTSTVTNTPFPTMTVGPTLTLVPTDTYTPTKSPCNQPLKSWKVPTTTFLIVNETKPKGKIILSMTALTSLGECGYLVINGSSFSGPVGSYGAFAYVTGEKNFTVSGSFIIKNIPYKIIVRNEKIVEMYSCYPHC